MSGMPKLLDDITLSTDMALEMSKLPELMASKACPKCGVEMDLVKAERGKIGWRWFCAECQEYFPWTVIRR